MVAFVQARRKRKEPPLRESEGSKSQTAFWIDTFDATPFEEGHTNLEQQCASAQRDTLSRDHVAQRNGHENTEARYEHWLKEHEKGIVRRLGRCDGPIMGAPELATCEDECTVCAEWPATLRCASGC
jgi:hypothetical protein